MKLLSLAGADRETREVLLLALIRELTGAELRVSAAVRMSDGFEVDRPGKDSYEHRQAGAREVVLASGERWALMGDCSDDRGPREPELLNRLADADLVIAEGFDDEPIPCLYLIDSTAESSHGPVPKGPVLAHVGRNASVPAAGPPTFALDDIKSIATFIIERYSLSARPR